MNRFSLFGSNGRIFNNYYLSYIFFIHINNYNIKKFDLFCIVIIFKLETEEYNKIVILWKYFVWWKDFVGIWDFLYNLVNKDKYYAASERVHLNSFLSLLMTCRSDKILSLHKDYFICIVCIWNKILNKWIWFHSRIPKRTHVYPNLDIVILTWYSSREVTVTVLESYGSFHRCSFIYFKWVGFHELSIPYIHRLTDI